MAAFGNPVRSPGQPLCLYTDLWVGSCAAKPRGVSVRFLGNATPRKGRQHLSLSVLPGVCVHG